MKLHHRQPPPKETHINTTPTIPTQTANFQVNKKGKTFIEVKEKKAKQIRK
jgi:hypothetical protein